MDNPTVGQHVPTDMNASAAVEPAPGPDLATISPPRYIPDPKVSTVPPCARKSVQTPGRRVCAKEPVQATGRRLPFKPQTQQQRHEEYEARHRNGLRYCRTLIHTLKDKFKKQRHELTIHPHSLKHKQRLESIIAAQDKVNGQ